MIIHTFDEKGKEMEYEIVDVEGFLNGTPEDDLILISEEVKNRNEYYTALKGLMEKEFVKCSEDEQDITEIEIERVESCIRDNSEVLDIVSDKLSFFNKLRLQELDSQIRAEAE